MKQRYGGYDVSPTIVRSPAQAFGNIGSPRHWRIHPYGTCLESVEIYFTDPVPVVQSSLIEIPNLDIRIDTMMVEPQDVVGVFRFLVPR